MSYHSLVALVVTCYRCIDSWNNRKNCWLYTRSKNWWRLRSDKTGHTDLRSEGISRSFLFIDRFMKKLLIQNQIQDKRYSGTVAIYIGNGWVRSGHIWFEKHFINFVYWSIDYSQNAGTSVFENLPKKWKNQKFDCISDFSAHIQSLRAWNTCSHATVAS